MNFGGEPSSISFAKRYELHYQLKKVEVDGGEKFQQFSCLNFHVRRGGRAKLTPAVKNKWSSGWMRVWFYCKVHVHVCSQGWKTVHVLCSHMCGLDFWTEPPFDYAVDDSRDIAFARATKFQDVVEEFLACGKYPLVAGVSFDRVTDGVTPVSRLKLPLPKFVVIKKDDEDDVQFLARVELDFEGVVGSYTYLEHNACVASLCNEGCLNCVFELALGPSPRP
jgi:hypothetical protein